MRIGIPRALLYYQYLALWKTFFQEMGCEVVLSSQTNKAILSGGTSRVVAETCLPVKAYCGHIIDLKGKCDFIFVPSLTRTEKNATNCSKLIALPDMVKAVVPGCPPLLEIDIDVNKGKRELYEQIYSLGRHFTWNPLRVKNAFVKAWKAHQDYLNLMSARRLSIPQALPEIEKSCLPAEQTTTKGNQQAANSRQDAGCAEAGNSGPTREAVAIGLIGHPYMLYDDFINHRLRERLEKLGAVLQTPEMVTREDTQKAIVKLVGKSYWGYEDEIVGAGGHYLDSEVDGVIAAVAFGCGPDSLMIDLVARYAREKARKPFLNLTFDEHTGEAGILTRLEAFTDMLKRRKAALSSPVRNDGLAS